MNIKTEIIGAIALGVIILGLVLWYMSEHPAPYIVNHTGTSTPQNVGGTNNGQLNLNESAAYYDITAVYPASTPLKKSAGATADAKAVEIMKQFEINTILAFKEQGNFDHLSHDDIQMMGLDQRKESVEIKYEVKSGPRTVSYVYTIYQDTLGAHPNTYFRTFTFDSRTGEGLDIPDFFVAGTNYLSILSTAARKALPASIAAREGVSVKDLDADYMNRGTTPDADNFQNWYIEGSSLVLVFPPYQVAPYSAGVQMVSIPFSQFGTSLNAKYR